MLILTFESSDALPVSRPPPADHSQLAERVGEKLNKEPASLGTCAGSHVCAGRLCVDLSHGSWRRAQGVYCALLLPCVAPCTLSMVYAEAHKARTGRLQRKSRAAAGSAGGVAPASIAMKRAEGAVVQEIV